MKAIEVSEFGNSNVLKYKELKDPVMKDDEIYVSLKAQRSTLLKPMYAKEHTRNCLRSLISQEKMELGLSKL
ncbi:hypothetical protein ACMHYE_08515 [Lactococcus petauri]